MADRVAHIQLLAFVLNLKMLAPIRPDLAGKPIVFEELDHSTRRRDEFEHCRVNVNAWKARQIAVVRRVVQVRHGVRTERRLVFGFELLETHGLIGSSSALNP